MPINRLFTLLVVVITLAAGTIAVALIALDLLPVSPVFGLAGLSLAALCAALAWRVFSNRSTAPK